MGTGIDQRPGRTSSVGGSPSPAQLRCWATPVTRIAQRGSPRPRAISVRWMSLVPPPTTYMIDRRSPYSKAPPPGTPGTSLDNAATGPRISRVASPKSSASSPPIMFLTSLGYNAGTYQSQYKGLGAWFRRRRGLAFGLLTIGGGLGGTVLAPVVAELVVRYGWRVTVAVLGAVIIVVVMTMSWFFRPSGPERYGLHVDGDAEDAARKHAAELAARVAATGVSTTSFSLKQAFKTRAFWFLVIAFGLHNLSITVITVHGVNLATGLGIPITDAAVAFGAMATLSLPLRLLAPWLGDRFNMQWISIACLVLAGAGPPRRGPATQLSGGLLGVVLDRGCY